MNRSCHRRHPRHPLRLGAFLLFGTSAAFAQTWDGGGNNNNWSTADNWSLNSVPVSGAAITFDGTNRTSPNLNQDWNIAGLIFDANAAAFTLGGSNGLTIGSGGITSNSPAAQTINNQITLSANQAWTANSGSITTTAYVNAASNNLALAGSGAISVFGQLGNVGTLATSGSGNRSFGGQVSASTINLASTGSTTFNQQINVSNALNISAGTTTFSTIAGSLSGGINVTGTANANFVGAVNGGSTGITISSSGNVNFTGGINSGSITLNGTGTTTISGTGNVSTGAVTVNSGTLLLDHTANNGNGTPAINSSLTVNSGGTVIFGEDNQIPAWQTVTLNAGSSVYLNNTSQTFTNLVITGDTLIDFGGTDSQLNLTAYSNGISIANGVTITIKNWDAAAGDVFSGSNPGSNVVNVVYVDNNGTPYATGTWGGNQITPGAPVPEPASAGLLVLGGLTGLALLRRRPRRASA